MKKLLLIGCLSGMQFSMKAQTRCDSLIGDWLFVRVETDDFYFDMANNSRGIKHAAEDSVKIIKELEERISEIKKNGPMKITLNSNNTYSWHGALYVPNNHKSGAFKCTDENYIWFSDDKKDIDKFDPEYRYKLIYIDGQHLSLMHVGHTLKYVIFTFKRK